MLTTIFYHCDNFCNYLENSAKKCLINEHEIRPIAAKMTLAEIMTIMAYWPQSGFKTFKDFYEKQVLVHLKSEFPKTVSYSRFLELKKYATLPLYIFAKIVSGECTGTSFIDSTKLMVCNVKRITRHKTFKNLAKRGKTSMGWFFGFKLHIVVNQYREIIDFKLTTGNVDDRNHSVIDALVKKLKGLLFGDKGYIGLFDYQHNQGIKIVHGIRSNMKPKLMPLHERLLLNKRSSTVETAIGVLKSHLHLEHTRHRNPANFFCHVFSCLISYAFYIRRERLEQMRLIATI